jgi:hypothetical protein
MPFIARIEPVTGTNENRPSSSSRNRIRVPVFRPSAFLTVAGIVICPLEVIVASAIFASCRLLELNCKAFK